MKLIESSGYKEDRRRIMDSTYRYVTGLGDNPKAALSFFRTEEKDLQKRIKTSPLSAGVDFPKPTKKGTTGSGKYVILYTCLPPNAATNPAVTQVNLDSIIPTTSYKFNLLDGLIQADLEEDNE